MPVSYFVDKRKKCKDGIVLGIKEAKEVIEDELIAKVSETTGLRHDTIRMYIRELIFEKRLIKDDNKLRVI